MTVYFEAMLLLLPPDAGGRRAPVAPREGSYRPYVEVDGRVSRALLLEGPPLLAPGDEARVVMELEADDATLLAAGTELRLLEPRVADDTAHDDAQVVGVANVLRVCRSTSLV